MNNIADELRRKIADLTKELDRVEEKERNAALSADTLEKQVAILLHKNLCTHDHTAGCSWFYEISRDGSHKWDNTSEHAHYLKRANHVVRALGLKIKHWDDEDVLKIINVCTNRNL